MTHGPNKWPDEQLCKKTNTASTQQDAFLMSNSVFECAAETVTVTSDPAFSPPTFPAHLMDNSTNQTCELWRKGSLLMESACPFVYI